MRYPLFGLGDTGRSPNLSAQRRINLFAEVKQDADKSGLVFYGTPGKTLFTSFGDPVTRGLWQMGDYLYVVNGGTLYRVNSSGTITSLGGLSTTAGRVVMSDNGTQVMLVDGSFGYIYDASGGTFAKITDADFLANPTSVTFQDGYFIVTFANSAKFQISALYDGTNWAALDFAKAEANPDNLVAVLAAQGQICLFGELTTEFWTNTGAADFPYARIQGSTTEWGLAAKNSLVKFNDSVTFLGRNKLGEVEVVAMQGYTPTPISTPEVSQAINAYAATSDATGMSYRKGGHSFYQLNFPTAGVSWLFDGNMGAWSELQSGSLGARDAGEIAIQWNSKTYVSDYANGRIYLLDLNTYTENGATIVRELTSKHVYSEQLMHVYRLWLDLEVGVGNAVYPGDNPQVMLRVSKNGGKTWGPERTMSMQRQGAYGLRCYVNRLGRSYDWTFKFRISDPVKVTILGAWLDTESIGNDSFVLPVPRAVA